MSMHCIYSRFFSVCCGFWSSISVASFFFSFLPFLFFSHWSLPSFYPPCLTLLHQAPYTQTQACALSLPTPPHLTDHHVYIPVLFLVSLTFASRKPLWNQRSFHQLTSYHNLSHRNTFIHLLTHFTQIDIQFHSTCKSACHILSPTLIFYCLSFVLNFSVSQCIKHKKLL